MYSAEHPRVWNQIENRILNRIGLLWQWDGKTCEQLQVGKVGILVCRVRYCATYLLPTTGLDRCTAVVTTYM